MTNSLTRARRRAVICIALADDPLEFRKRLPAGPAEILGIQLLSFQFVVYVEPLIKDHTSRETSHRLGPTTELAAFHGTAFGSMQQTATSADKIKTGMAAGNGTDEKCTTGLNEK